MSATAIVPGWDLDESPFHPGEQAVQARLGLREKMESQGRRTIRRFMPEQHRLFYAQLPYFFIGSVDADGQPWASVVVGRPGFVTALNETTLRVNAEPLAGDPLRRTLKNGAAIAGLGVELPTRRRNRVSGIATDVGPDGFTIQVRQTMGLCNKYIQARTLESALVAASGPVRSDGHLSPAAQQIIARADTAFVASADLRDGAAGGVDISHRGGLPGFLRVDDATTLVMPEYPGNNMFNTLGNFARDNRAGLLVPDFASGDLVFLAATAEVTWDGPDLAAFPGALRLVRYRVGSVVHAPGALPLRFAAPEFSPALLRVVA